MTPIVVSGALANKSRSGGEAWVRMNWVLGLRRLGFDVYFVEQISAAPALAEGIRYFEAVMAEFGLLGRAALLRDDGEHLAGLHLGELMDAAPELLINISGHLCLEPLFSRFKRRVFIDIDPGFTQFWSAAGNPGARLDGHDVFYTIGQNIGSPECPIPTCGYEWRKTFPPVVMESWMPPPEPSFDRFTTVANWRGSYGAIEFQGRTFGLKVHEFRKFAGLPRLTGLPFEVALGIHPGDHKDRTALEAQGWRIVDPSTAAGTPGDYREYVRSSGAEFSVAQGIYVQTSSGWFSDRTAVYLAAGKPALVQDTGFSRRLPAGRGLMAFASLDEAAGAAAEIAAHHSEHSRAARAVAEEFFDSDKVLGRLLAEVAP
ncbi:MAG: hypothetical protein QOE70_1291 [Chthoniobacter sp.]|nr:hypothetical protein [Chthoniobacter sp.]